MCVIPSYVFRGLLFLHEGNLVTIDQLSYTWKSRTKTSESNVPLIDQLCPTNESLGVGMYTSLMGNFDMVAPIKYLGMTSVGEKVCAVVDRTETWVFPSQEDPDVPL